MIEFIISGKKDEDFNLHFDTWRKALRPLHIPVEHSPGFGIEHLRIVVDGKRISFSPEPPGWQVVFEDEVTIEWATQMAQSICDNMAHIYGQSGKILRVQ